MQLEAIGGNGAGFVPMELLSETCTYHSAHPLLTIPQIRPFPTPPFSSNLLFTENKLELQTDQS